MLRLVNSQNHIEWSQGELNPFAPIQTSLSDPVRQNKTDFESQLERFAAMTFATDCHTVLGGQIADSIDASGI
jgi:hypothetical protein